MGETRTTDNRMMTKLLFRLLPVQILLASINAINGIVSSVFASNFIGPDAMSAVGLYGPINQLLYSMGLMLVTGSTILCGKYMGENQLRRMENVFSLDLILCTVIAVAGTAVIVIMSAFDLTGMMMPDAASREILNHYLMGQAVGIFPYLTGTQLSSFLSLENKVNRTTAASIIFILVNILFNYLFVDRLKWGTFGLALASSLGMWVFLLVQAQYYFSGKSEMKLILKGLNWREGFDIAKIGFAGAITQYYVALRGFIVNGLITMYVGKAGLSAFAASDAILKYFWAIPVGMAAVSRMMISVSVGEEDRRSLTDVMRTALFRFVPLMCVISAIIMALAVPFTMCFYRDPSEPVFYMTVWAFRLLPLCMPLSLICMHFVCYALASDKQIFVHFLSLLDGVVCVSAFSALLIGRLGMNGVYIANILNGIVTTIVIVAYACIKKKGFPKNMEELMVIPADFGVDDRDRLDFAIHGIEDVVGISEEIHSFCAARDIDNRRAFLASLALEEMAGNVVTHGFGMDKKEHRVSARTILKGGDVILCLKDDCMPFDPVTRQRISDPEDKASNIGLRIVCGMAKDLSYQNILGLNVLTVRV